MTANFDAALWCDSRETAGDFRWCSHRFSDEGAKVFTFQGTLVGNRVVFRIGKGGGQFGVELLLDFRLLAGFPDARGESGGGGFRASGEEACG